MTAKTKNKRLYAKVTAKPQPERPHLMDLEDDIPETPEARQTTLT